MARDTLTGSRIRERRSVAGLRQAELARRVGISASYLNLIEHNRRRIGGKLLLDIAAVLDVEPSMLTEGAEAALLMALREAAAATDAATPELDKLEEFAGRFPGWAGLLAAAQRRVGSLQETVQTLSDRLTHDPHLAASLHEVLTTAAAIRATASILVETGEIEDEWRDRFHRNINADARRLADSSKALMSYLDDSDSDRHAVALPQEEAEAFLAAREFHFPELEDGDATPEALVSNEPDLKSPQGQVIAQVALDQMRQDSAALPLKPFRQALGAFGLDPTALARQFDVPLQQVFRRLAALPDGMLPVATGLVICDASGSILFRKPVEGFALPRFGASCPLWPVFSALTRPLVPIRRRVTQLGRSERQFDCMAVAWPETLAGFNEDPVYRSAMLILPVTIEDEQPDAQEVGSACRVCPRQACSARREPSILGDGF
ncbi:MAG: DUF2083 domain-containing protein [Rhodobacteraceae bacterium]|nr:DUF2083 domain-containing protein [Paracoccaceae bacterium]